MPLNYSKWDRLELSDDSDIEGHPNVDKRSLIRWNQRNIHEKREARKHKIANLKAETALNDVLYPRMQSIHSSLAQASPSPSVYFNTIVEQLEKNPSPDAPPTNAPGQPTYDAMMLSLLTQVGKAARDKLGDMTGLSESEREAKLGKALQDELGGHMTKLLETTEQLKKDLEAEEREQKKHITSDDMQQGWESKYVPPKPEPPPVPHTKLDKDKKTIKTTTTEFEVLNPQASSSQAPPPSTSNENEEDALPELTPSLESFSKIGLGQYEKSFEFIQSHRDVIVPGASDALLVTAFRAQSEGKARYAEQCVHQSLLLQYCEKLGGDGVHVFFTKMISGDKRALKVFEDDVHNTYGHLVTRAKLAAEESQEPAGREQIQLVPENASTTISFNVPPGPPPEQLMLEGPGTEGLDVEEVRKALQMRWDIFSTFSEAFQEALKSESLEKVNKVLGEMDVAEAENYVERLNMAGILSFAEGGIRDETGKPGEDESNVR